MKKIIILVAMLLLGVHSINAARRAVYLSFSNNGLSGKKGNANRAPMHLPVNVVYDSDARVIEVNGSELLDAEITSTMRQVSWRTIRQTLILPSMY